MASPSQICKPGSPEVSYQDIYGHMFLPRPVPESVFKSLLQSRLFLPALVWAHYSQRAGKLGNPHRWPLPQGFLYPHVVTVNPGTGAGTKPAARIVSHFSSLNP